MSKKASLLSPILEPLTDTEAAKLVKDMAGLPTMQLKIRRLLLERDQLKKRLGPPHSYIPEYNTGRCL